MFRRFLSRLWAFSRHLKDETRGDISPSQLQQKTTSGPPMCERRWGREAEDELALLPRNKMKWKNLGGGAVEFGLRSQMSVSSVSLQCFTETQAIASFYEKGWGLFFLVRKRQSKCQGFCDGLEIIFIKEQLCSCCSLLSEVIFL